MDGLPAHGDQTGSRGRGAGGHTGGGGCVGRARCRQGASTSPRSSTTTASGCSPAAVANDQAALEALLDRAAGHGTPGLVIDQPGSIAQLALAVAARRRRAGGVCAGPGDAPRRGPVPRRGQDRPARRLRASPTPAGPDASRSTGSMPALMSCSTRCGSSTGSTSTWPPTRPGWPTGCRDALTSISPALERAVGRPAAPGRRTGPAGQVPDPERAASGRASPDRADGQGPLAPASRRRSPTPSLLRWLPRTSPSPPRPPPAG